ncbi:MAG TPA: tyrosine-type recombinase/integrase [Ktedonobacterales bacterium]|nr:tyrosine-type recombinase/integrase [Ktedonobacterales bacterium]
MIRTPPAADHNTASDPGEVDLFAQDLSRQEVAHKTLVNYQSDLLCFARWFAGVNDEPFTAAAVTPTDLRDYRTYLIQEECRTPATVNRRLAALRKFFTWAKATARIQDLPTDAVKGVEASPRAPKALEKREMDRLIRAVEKEQKKRDLAIVLTLRHTGLRVSELCALRLGDVELGERKGSVTVRAGKGSKYRVVPLNLDARKAIQDYLAVRPAVPDDHLFIGQRHQGLSPQAVENLVTKYARLAGLADVTPHTLRHSFGKGLLDSGVDLVAVAALLGHSRLETTAMYTHPSARDLEHAVQRLERDALPR